MLSGIVLPGGIVLPVHIVITPPATIKIVPPPTWTGAPIDHPVLVKGDPGVYTPTSGTLYDPSGVSVYSDVHQGATLGDCWLLSPLADAAARDPQLIASMFTPVNNSQGNNDWMENGVAVEIWAVRYFNIAGRTITVTVDNEFPAGSYRDQILGNVLWVALAEKAYVQAVTAGYSNGGYVVDNLYCNVTNDNAYGTNCYAGIDFGNPVWSLNAITGHAASAYGSNADGGLGYDASACPADGNLVVLVTPGTATYTPPTLSTDLVPAHCYAVLSTTGPASDPFVIFNPWNVGAYFTWWNQSTDSYQVVFGGVFDTSASWINANFAGVYWAQS